MVICENNRKYIAEQMNRVHEQEAVSIDGERCWDYPVSLGPAMSLGYLIPLIILSSSRGLVKLYSNSYAGFFHFSVI